LQIAAEQLHWLRPWLASHFEELWSVVDGAYAKRPFLRAAKEENFIVVSRLRKDAALWSVPEPVPPEKRGRGRPPTYGKQRISLAKRAQAWLAAGRMPAVQQESGQDDQDVSGDVASGRGCNPRGAGPRRG
jgi:hypothetical protein